MQASLEPLTLLKITLGGGQHPQGDGHKNVQTQQLVQLTPEECKWSLLLYWERWECEKSPAYSSYVSGEGGKRELLFIRSKPISFYNEPKLIF